MGNIKRGGGGRTTESETDDEALGAVGTASVEQELQVAYKHGVEPTNGSASGSSSPGGTQKMTLTRNTPIV